MAVLNRLQSFRRWLWGGVTHPVSLAIAAATVIHGLILAIPVPDKSKPEPEPTPTETIKISSLLGEAPPSPKPTPTPTPKPTPTPTPQPTPPKSVSHPLKSNPKRLQLRLPALFPHLRPLPHRPPRPLLHPHRPLRPLPHRPPAPLPVMMTSGEQAITLLMN